MIHTPFSRRRFLALVPASLAVAACAPASAGATVDIREFGAKGDGTTDDSAAIADAVAALTSGGILQFPAGVYRFAQQNPAGQAAVSIAGLNDVTVEFAPGAELLMDNLSSGGAGTSHGIVVRGPASNITLSNVVVRWAAQPSSRSFGDGIRVVGFPSDAPVPGGWTGSQGMASGISLSNCVVHSSPQAGVIMMGVSDIDVTNLRVENTMADGLHFNACRRATISGHSATNAGDDGLALVTYYSEEFAFDNEAETFSFPDLTDWSDADFTIRGVTVSGGRANGVRAAGANRVSISGLTVRDKRTGSGVVVDSAARGSDADWLYVATRGLTVDQVDVEGCETGIHVLARPTGAADERFSDFDVRVSGANIRNCPSWSVLAESVTDQPLTGFSLDDCTVVATATSPDTAAVGLQTTQGISLGTVSITTDQPIVAFSASDSGGFTVSQLAVTITGSGGDPDSAEPCVQFQSSDGVVESATVNWPQAPESWVPVRISGGSDERSAASVDIATLTVDPGVAQNIETG